MKDAKTILNLIGDKYMLNNPNFFYSEVVYFPTKRGVKDLSPLLKISDIFVDQIDIKLVEEQSEEAISHSNACFFFKN